MAVAAAVTAVDPTYVINKRHVINNGFILSLHSRVKIL